MAVFLLAFLKKMDFKFGFIGLTEVAPAKELEGLGQPLSFASNNLTRGGGKETSASEMVLSPYPGSLWVAVKSIRYQQLLGSKPFSRRLWERGQEPSQTPKFPAPPP